MNDLELLRQFEPVVRFTKGEMFFPCAVDGYLTLSSLWMADAERNVTLEAQPGELDAAALGDYQSVPRSHRLYLQFVERPLSPVDYQRWLRQPDRPVLVGRSRLQRIGLVTRTLDGAFGASLLVRGRVPGGTAAAAQRQYAALHAEDPRRVYYGRVVRTGGYIVLHYFFFFAMNDWRSTYQGVNDHESDWEQILIYLSDEGEEAPVPRWVAYASHDFSGDDLRRRWDDPELEIIDDTHPVIYAGAGSHASYYQPGEYLMQVTPKFLAPLRGAGRAVDRGWRDTLNQATSLNLESGLGALSSIPFVDYARGDGLRIGPGQAEEWTPILISDEDGWVDGYRGLWGLDTWDPLGGERAPAGPKYNRDGSIRLSWRDPLAWAGLDKVPPPKDLRADIAALVVGLEGEQASLRREIETQMAAVRRLELEVEVLRSTQFLSSILTEREEELAAEINQLQVISARLTDIEETQEAIRVKQEQLQSGDLGGSRAHIKHAHVPQAPLPPSSRFSLWWSAVSGGLLLLLLGGLVYLHPHNWIAWLFLGTMAFAGLDAAVHGRLTIFLPRLTIALALLTSAILFYLHWRLAIVVALTVLVVSMIRDNLREVFGR